MDWILTLVTKFLNGILENANSLTGSAPGDFCGSSVRRCFLSSGGYATRVPQQTHTHARAGAGRR